MRNTVSISEKLWKRIYETDGLYPPDIPKKIVDKFIRAVGYLHNVNDLRDMSSYPGFNPKPKEAEWKGYRAINLDKQRRLLFKIDKSSRPLTIYIDYVSNRHYK